MRNYIFQSLVCLFCSVFIAGCLQMLNHKKNDAPVELPTYVPGYYAIDPIVIGNKSNSPNDKKPDPDLANLYNVGSKSTQYSVSANGKITYLSSGVQAKTGTYSITVDHLTYSPMELILEYIKKDGSKITVPVGLVLGIAIRIKGNATAREGSFALSDIPGLGASAAASKAGANVEIEVVGIKNSTILKLPRYIGDLNSNTLQTLIQNIATINAEIDGDNTEIVPQIIGVDIKSLPEDVELYDVVAALRAWKSSQVEKKAPITIDKLSGRVETFPFVWERSGEFVEEQRRRRVEKLIDEIDNLSNDMLISLAKSPPIQDTKINAAVAARDPSKRRLTDANAAKEILKMMIVLGKRNDEQLNAWEAAIKATQ